MRFTKKTEYGVVSMVYLARHDGKGVLSIKDIAAHEDYPVPYIEKILQALKRAGLVLSVQGNHGG